MTKLLTILFVKDYKNPKSPSVRRAFGSLAGVVGIILNLMLSAFKFAAGIFGGSVSITADALNNLADASSSVIALVSFRMAAKSPDRRHPFGHARIEYVASMIISFTIILVGFQLFLASVKKIINPEPVTFSLPVAVILIVSVIIKLWLTLFNRKISKKISSPVLKATGWDSFTDAIATSAVLAAVILSYKTSFNADAYMGIIVSFIIAIAGVRILNEAKNLILNTPTDPHTIDAIYKITRSYPDILGIHDLVVHSYGAGNTMASMHAEVDGKLDIFYIHDVIDSLERALLNELGIKIAIHMDPVVTDDKELISLCEQVGDAVSQVSEFFCPHDIRVVRGKTYTKLIFDVSVPFEEKMTDLEIKDSISDKISFANINFFAVITIDRE